jgi:predicted lipoprotein
MKKWLKYIVLIAVAGLLAYNSVYFKKLDAKKEVVETDLNPAAFAQKFWTEKFTSYLDSALEINEFAKMLQENPKDVFEKYSKTQGIGNVSYFLVKGEGVITDVPEDNVIVLSKAGTAALTVKLNTGIYFGNAVRDVTGLISMGDFSNTMDFNSVSSELNKIVRTQVVLPFKTNAAKGKTVQFVGCAEINKEQINITDIQVLPVRININK